jgi:hypothetical protein
MPVGHRANGRLPPWATGTMREAGRHRGHPYQAKTRVPVDWSWRQKSARSMFFSAAR